MAYNWTTEWPGVYARHADECPLRRGGDCTCAHVTYRASAKAPDERSRILSPEFDTAIEARDWLRDQRARLTAASAVAEEGPAVSAVIREFLGAAERGEARDHAGAAYNRQRVSEMRAGLAYVEGQMGSALIQSVRRRHVQALVDELHAAGLSSDRVIAVISTLRELFVYAIQRDLVDFNPIVQLRLPADDRSAPGPAPMDTSAYASGYSANGNGNRAAGDLNVATAPYAPPFTAETSNSQTGWTPGAFDAVEPSDQPFDDEPTYGPAGPVLAQEARNGAPSAPLGGATWPAFAAGGPPRGAVQTPPSPAAVQPAPPTAALQTPPPSVAAPTPPPPAAPQAAPPPAAAQAAARAPWAPLSDEMPDLGAPATELYDVAPMFAPPRSSPQTPVPAPIGAETHYGTPTYGTEARTTQAPAQAPKQTADSDDGVMVSEQMFWWITRIVVIVFVLIALVLVAESV
ncbi:MAG: hypothetical protein ACJ77Z_18680 [Thermoleophilaceae bacterium]|jgi:hypothetical protein